MLSTNVDTSDEVGLLRIVVLERLVRRLGSKRTCFSTVLFAGPTPAVLVGWWLVADYSRPARCQYGLELLGFWESHPGDVMDR